MGPGVYYYIVLAKSDWALFRHGKSATAASTASEDETVDLSCVLPPVSQSSTAPKPSTLPPASATPAPSLTPELPPPVPRMVSSSSATLEAPPPLNDTSDTYQAGAAKLVEVPKAPDLTHGRSDPDPLTSVEDFIHTFINEHVPTAPTPSHLQENARPDSNLGDGAMQNVNHGSPANILANISNAPAWMKKKQTLEYLCSTPKLGCFSDVIQHWYELEELLGFPHTVSSDEDLI